MNPYTVLGHLVWYGNGGSEEFQNISEAADILENRDLGLHVSLPPHWQLAAPLTSNLPLTYLDLNIECLSICIIENKQMDIFLFVE